MQHPSSTPALHREFLERALLLFAADVRVAGVAAAGSYAQDTMDEFSDIDLVLTCDAADFRGPLDDRVVLARKLGPLVAAFTGEHVGEPRLLICLYGPPALHVDIKLVTLDDLGERVDEPVVLWERSGCMTRALAESAGRYPLHDAQWIEDRFWVWTHYAALKIARGELQEALDFLSYLRVTVLGPLGLQRAGLPPAGVRRVEQVPQLAAILSKTVGALDRKSLFESLEAAIDAYRELRSADVRQNRAAERVALDWVRRQQHFS